MAWYDKVNSSLGQSKKPLTLQPVGNVSWATRINSSISTTQNPTQSAGFTNIGGQSYPTGSLVSPQSSASIQPPKPQPIKPLFNFGNFLNDAKNKVGSFIDSLDDEKRREEANKRGEDLVRNMQKGFAELGKEILRAGPRALVSTGLSINRQKEITPGVNFIPGTEKAEKFLLGDRPVKDIRGTGEQTIMDFGGSKETAIKWGLPLGVALTGLDLFPGLPKKKVAETLAKVSNPQAITKILKTEVFKDISDDVAESLARRLTPLKSVKEVEAELDLFAKNGFNVAEEIKGSDTIIGDITSGFKGGREAREVAEKETKGSFGQRLRTETIDRLTPVYDFVKKAGKDLPVERNPYKKMRLLAGVSGKVEAFLEGNIAPILKREVKRQDDLSALLVLERERELLGRGLTRKRTVEQVEQGIQELKTKYGEEGYQTLQNSADEIRKVGGQMLDELKDAGIIDDVSYNTIKKNNEFYTPFEAVEHIADDFEKGRFGTGSFNVASQDVIKGVGNYIGDVADPIESLVRKIPKVLALTEKNRAMQSLVGLRKQAPDIYGNLIFPIKEGSTQQGMGIINVFENGENVRYAVPEVIESAVKNLDAETSGILIKLGSIQAKILRAGATGLNIGFIPVNIIRDVQDALTTEFSERGAKAMVRFLASYPQAIFSAAGKGNLYREWAKSGGLQSTMTEQIFERTPKTVAELSGKKSVIKTVLKSPKSLIEFANRVGEQSTRLARFKSGVARGESLEEAAFKSRDISLDFAKAGNKIKALNQVIPFLNAGIQGTEKVMRLYKTNPKRAIAATGILFGVPTVALYNYNSQFKDYDDIPNAEKEGNWIIIARDRTPEEIKAGEKVIGIKIPKGFLGRMVSNTTEAGMEFMKKRDAGTFAKSSLKTVAGLSPVGVPYNQEELGQTLSTIMPPWIQAGVEGITNKNLYFGSPIIPKSMENVEASEQYKETTPEVYKKAGEILNVSPLILENTVNSTTGGLGRQLAELASGNLEKGTIDQLKRRFSGIQAGSQTDKEFDEVAGFMTKSKTESLNKQREAEELFSELKQLPKEEANQRAREIKQENPSLYDKLKDVSESEKLGLSSLERFVKALPVEDGSRAKYIWQKANELKTSEEKNNYLNDLRTKKVISDKVLEQLKILKEKQPKESEKQGFNLLDKIIPPAYAAEESSLLGSTITTSDFKTGKTTVTKNPGIVEQTIKKAKSVFKKDLVSPFVEAGKNIESTAKKTPDIEKKESKPTKPLKDGLDELVKKVFPKDQWDNVPRVLAGENANHNPKAENKNKNGSIDRGLMQINSNTFDDFMRRKGNLLKSKGITSYDDMYDPQKNLTMAKIIWDEQGWKAWFGAPKDLRE